MNKVCIKCKNEFSARIHGDLCKVCRKEKLEHDKHFKLCNSCGKINYFSSTRHHYCDKCLKLIQDMLNFNSHNMECTCCNKSSYFSTAGIKMKNTLKFRPSARQTICDICTINGNLAKNQAVILNNLTNKICNIFYIAENNISIKNKFYYEYISSKKYNNILKFSNLRDLKINNEKYYKFISNLSANLALKLYNCKNLNDKFINNIINCFIKGINNEPGYCIQDLSNLEEKFLNINLSEILYKWYEDLPDNIAKHVLDTIFFFKQTSTEGVGEFMLKMFSNNICRFENSNGDIHYINGKTAEVKSMISEGKAGRLIHNRDNHFSVRTEEDKQYAINIIKNTNFYKHLNNENKELILNKLNNSECQDFLMYKSNEKQEIGIYKFLYNICKNNNKEDLTELVEIIIRKLCFNNYNEKLLLTNIDLSIEDNLHIFGLINSIYIYLNEIKNDQLILAAPDKFIIINKLQLENYTLIDCKHLLSLVTPVFPTTELTLTGNTNDRNKNRGFAIIRKF